MKPSKQALLAELTAALSPLLPTTASGNIPPRIAQAVENLADSLLRWQANQHLGPRLTARMGSSSESDQLTQLMSSPLHEDEQDTAPLKAPLPASPPVPATARESSTTVRKRRPRLGGSH